jgi:hypothetical protein
MTVARPRLAGSVLALLASAISAAEEPPPGGGRGAGPGPGAERDEVIRRLDRVERKLDRLEELLRIIYGDRLRRAEAIAADEGLASAIDRVEERYGLSGVAAALTSEGIRELVDLRNRLARAAAERGQRLFARDPDVHRVVAALAARPEFMEKNARRLVVSISGGDPGAAAHLVAGLLPSPPDARGEDGEPGAEAARREGGDASSANPGVVEAALFGSFRAEGPELVRRLSEFARSVPAEEARVHLLAQAAAARAGDEGASKRLVEALRGAKAHSALAQQIAGELEAAGSDLCFVVYLELLRDERYAFAAARAFERIEGFDRRVDWREVRERAEELHDEYGDWLERNRERLSYVPQRRRFKLLP